MRITKDNVINAVCIFGIVIAICFMLTVMLKSFYAEKIDVAFIKDIFSIGATLAAALIAISLFTDWKEQHNLQVLAHEAKEAFSRYHNQRDIIQNFKFQIQHLIDNNYIPKTSESSIATKFEVEFINSYNIDKGKMSSFCYLSKGQNLYNITDQYHNKIQDIANQLGEKQKKPFSSTTFLDELSSLEFLEYFKSLEKENGKVLEGLRSYIFFN